MQRTQPSHFFSSCYYFYFGLGKQTVIDEFQISDSKKNNTLGHTQTSVGFFFLLLFKNGQERLYL